MGGGREEGQRVGGKRAEVTPRRSSRRPPSPVNANRPPPSDPPSSESHAPPLRARGACAPSEGGSEGSFVRVRSREAPGVLGRSRVPQPRGRPAGGSPPRRVGDRRPAQARGRQRLPEPLRGRGTPRGQEKAHFYEISRGNGTECAAALDILLLRRLAAPGAVAAARAVLHRLVCMLTALARHARGEGEGGAPAP